MLNMTRPSKFGVHTEIIDERFMAGNYISENVALMQYPRLKPVIDITDAMVEYLSTSAPALSEKNASFINYLKKNNRDREVEGDKVTWRLRKRATYNFRMIENMHPGETRVGMGPGGIVMVKLSNPNLVPGDIIHNLIAKDVTLIVDSVMGGDSTGTTYYCQKGSKFLNYFPAFLLKQDSKWCKIGWAGSEGSRGYGSFQFKPLEGYVRYEATMFDYAIGTEISNKAGELSFNYVFNAYNDDGTPFGDTTNYPTMLVNAVEAEMVATSRWEKEKTIAWGQDAGEMVLDETTQLYRRTGSGFFEWMSEAIKLKYAANNPNIDYFEDKFQSYWFDMVDYSNRNIVGMCGEALLKWMRDAMTKKFGGSAVQAMWGAFVGSGPSYDQGNYKGLSFPTGQFTKAVFFPAGSLAWESWGILNSRELNGDNFYRGMPMSAWEGVIFDLGMGNGFENNVELLHRMNSQFYSYVCGAYSPAGYITQGNSRGFLSSHHGRYYSFAIGDTYGMRFKDITLPIYIMPDVVR